MAEIRRTQSALEGCGALVLPLHGDLPPPEQDRALRPAETRRIVLATSIAETSLTVPGVRIVVDGGWRRTPRLDTATGLTRLSTVRISRAAADQRAGRAGREARALRSVSGRRRCTGVCPPSTGRKFWKQNCPAWCWNAPPGGRRRPICRFRTGRRPARSPLPSRCCKISARLTPKTASPPSAAKWLELAGIPGWQR